MIVPQRRQQQPAAAAAAAALVVVTAVVVVGVSPRTLAGHQACSDQEDYYQLSSRDVCPARATAADQAGTPAHPKAFWRHSSCTQWPACAVATAWGPFLHSALSLAWAASLHIPILRSVPCWQVPAVALKSVTASVAEALAQASEEPVRCRLAVAARWARPSCVWLSVRPPAVRAHAAWPPPA